MNDMKKKREVTVALAGIGGYGTGYAGRLLDEGARQGVRWVAGADPRPEGCPRLAEIRARGIPLYESLAELFREHRPELTIIASPIHFHCEQTCLALENGSHVLCEKPVAATIQEALAMERAAAAAGRFVAVGYQWSFSPPVQALKADIRAGRLGRPLCLKTLVSWPRTAAYYRRNAWAGALRDDSGRWVLDSPLSNATAHYLHNMLYVLGETRETSAAPARIEAELYRANAIGNHDTAFVGCRTAAGVAIFFHTAHAVPSNIGPVARYDFENAVVTLTSGAAEGLTARFNSGAVKIYGNPDEQVFRKLWECVEAVRGGAPPACGVRAAIPHLLCVNGAQDSMPEIAAFPETAIRREPRGENDTLTWVTGLQAAMIQCHDQNLLPHDHGDFAWARAGRPVELSGYSHFPGGRETT